MKKPNRTEKQPELKKNQPGSVPPPEMFHVGRENPRGVGLPKPAFVIRHRKGNGGVLITDLQDSLTSAEKSIIWAHFGRPYHIAAGGMNAEGTALVSTVKEVEPGTPEHFAHAARSLPHPFTIMAERFWKEQVKK